MVASVWVVPARPSLLFDQWRVSKEGIDTPYENFRWKDIESLSARFHQDSKGMWRTTGGKVFEKTENHHGELDVKLRNSRVATVGIPQTMAIDWVGDEVLETREAWIFAGKNWAPTVEISPDPKGRF
jgi:hypothetical protein